MASIVAIGYPLPEMWRTWLRRRRGARRHAAGHAPDWIAREDLEFGQFKDATAEPTTEVPPNLVGGQCNVLMQATPVINERKPVNLVFIGETFQQIINGKHAVSVEFDSLWTDRRG